MASYALIHGAGSDSWYWHLVAPRLRALGHDVVAPDLPCDDDTAGLAEYADVVVDAVGDRGHVILVAQSLGGFTAPLVCDRLPVVLLVLVAAMTPSPGESPGEWWSNTGHHFPDPFDPEVVFAHDLPPEVAAGVSGAPAPAVRHPVREAVASRRLAPGSDQVPAVQRGPLFPRRVPAAGRPGAARDRPRRDRQRPPPGPRPARGTRPAPRGLPHRVVISAHPTAVHPRRSPAGPVVGGRSW